MTVLVELWNNVSRVDWIWISAICLMILVLLSAWLIKFWHLDHRKGTDHQPAPLDHRKGTDHQPAPPCPVDLGSKEHQASSESEPRSEKKRWVIPTEYIEEVLRLSDQEGDLAEYKFWKKIADIFPETNEHNCATDFDTDVLHPAIITI